MDAELWSTLYPQGWETMWAPEQRAVATTQTLEDMRRLCLVRTVGREDGRFDNLLAHDGPYLAMRRMIHDQVHSWVLPQQR